MYPKDHSPPHFHVKFNEYIASFRVDDGELLTGSLPRKQLRLVQAWWELREEEIKAAWQRAANETNPGKIEPIK
ncbi:MAG: DUF4160 domain-containing protein [Cellulomonadaceae bacterium]|jgi:hypothetical protein|nr:DUF4160 domain-containing protein [Cellulomonadaceae bacterium]